MHGVVSVFDAARGDGYIVDETGETVYFHCIEIADGSRSIEVGARVRATRRVGLRGRDEAGQVTRVD